MKFWTNFWAPFFLESGLINLNKRGKSMGRGYLVKNLPKENSAASYMPFAMLLKVAFDRWER
jgi:hypothetical protein